MMVVMVCVYMYVCVCDEKSAVRDAAKLAKSLEKGRRSKSFGPENKHGWYLYQQKVTTWAVGVRRLLHGQGVSEGYYMGRVCLENHPVNSNVLIGQMQWLHTSN